MNANGLAYSSLELLEEIQTQASLALSGNGDAEVALARIRQLVDAKGPEATRDDPSLVDTYRSQARVLRKIIATIPYYVFWKDINSVYLGCNEVLAGIAGLEKPEDIVGRDDFMMPWKREEAEYFRLIDRRVMDSGQAELNIEEPQKQADGKQRVLLTSKVPLRDEAGEVVGILGIFTDITERKQLEADLMRAKEAAEASARAKSEFLAVMSHELRTPLTLILSPLETLLNERRRELSESAVSMLESVYRNAYRLRTLTEDVLAFSRHEAGQLELVSSALDLAKHIEQLVRDLSPVAESRGITLSLARMDASVGNILVDAAKFDKILLNLLGNALKFTPAGGRVTMELRRQGEKIAIFVRDTGTGIDPTDHERIFRRFEQVDAGSTRQHGGTGIGLSIVKTYAEMMGGSVHLESELGQGANFCVLIPATPATSAPECSQRDVLDPHARAFLSEPRRPVEIRVEASRRLPRVLVAEDNPDLRSYLEALLSQEFEVIAVSDGQQALEAALTTQPDVILSDVMMPRLDGFELIRKLKANAKLSTIPIVLLTARAGSEAMVDSLNRGADDYLSKPFSPLDLLARVRVAYRTKTLLEGIVDAERRAADLREKEALQAALSELSRISSLGEMAAAVAHEVNQPLAAIGLSASTCLRWLRDEQFNLDEARAAAERVSRDAKRAASVLDRVRGLFSQPTGAMLSVDLKDAAEEVISIVSDRFRGLGVAFRGEFAPGTPRVSGDRVQLQQVLLNLTTNAAEALKQGATTERQISIRIQPKNELVEVQVSDTGPGVPNTELRNIFRPFHTTKNQGMGIGLAICRTIVSRHGGELMVQNNTGAGCTFSFFLPVAPA